MHFSTLPVNNVYFYGTWGWSVNWLIFICDVLYIPLFLHHPSLKTVVFGTRKYVPSYETKWIPTLELVLLNLILTSDTKCTSLFSMSRRPITIVRRTNYSLCFLFNLQKSLCSVSFEGTILDRTWVVVWLTQLTRSPSKYFTVSSSLLNEDCNLWSKHTNFLDDYFFNTKAITTSLI